MITYEQVQVLDREQLWTLFLLGDEDAQKVRQYYQTGTLFIAQTTTKIVGLALVIPGTTVHELELKNIAVEPHYQGQGVGSGLITLISRQLAGQVQQLLVGTGDADLANLRFYLKNGFRFVGVRPDFFLSYPRPIVVDGIALRDMVILRKNLV